MTLSVCLSSSKLRILKELYDKLYIKRVFLEPGVYNFGIDTHGDQILNELPSRIKIESGKTTFVIVRSI